MIRHAAFVLVLAVVAIAGAFALASYSSAPATMTDTQAPAAARANPLLTPSPLPYGAPPFDQIQDADFAPAFEAGMKQQLEEVTAIADSAEPATFDNTLVALERSGELLTRVNLVFNGLSSANTNPLLQALQEEVAPKLAALDDAVFLNGKLFARVEAVWDQRAALKLAGQDLRLAEYYYKRFVRAGARLSDADKTKLKALNEEDASLGAKYTNMLMAATKAGALVASSAADLAGLTPEEVQAAAEAAKGRGLEGQWVIALQNTTQQPSAGLADRPPHPRALLHLVVDAHREGRRQRHAPGHREARLAPGAARGAARLPDARGVVGGRADGREARRRRGVPRAAGAAGHGERARRGARHPGAHRPAEGRLHARALGLGLLRRAGPQGALRPEQRVARALPLARPRAGGRRLLRRRSSCTA